MRSGGFYPADKNCQTEQQQDKLQICQTEREPPALLHGVSCWHLFLIFCFN